MYNFTVTSFPEGIDVKWGMVEKIIYNGNAYTEEEFIEKGLSFFNDFDEIEKLVITIEEEVDGESKPSPQMIVIDSAGWGISPLVEKILINNHIEHKTKPLEVVNESEIEYKMVFFPEMHLFDAEQSNAELDAKGKYVTKGSNQAVSTPLFYNKNLDKIQGIVRVKDFNFQAVCTEEVKKLFEINKITGVVFEKIADTEQYKDFYISAACSYIYAIENKQREYAKGQVELIKKLYNLLQSTEEGQTGLRALLSHYRAPVRFCAAVQLFLEHTEQALKTLEGLKEEQESIIAPLTKLTIQEWKRGSLKQDLLYHLINWNND